MKRIELAQLHRAPSNFADQVVTVAGWVRTIRDSKALGFLELTMAAASKGYKWYLRKKRFPITRKLPARMWERPWWSRERWC